MPSTVIAFSHYDAASHVLEIGYRSGARYKYLNVPESEYERFRKATSKGRYLNLKIKPKYAFERT